MQSTGSIGCAPETPSLLPHTGIPFILPVPKGVSARAEKHAVLISYLQLRSWEGNGSCQDYLAAGSFGERFCIPLFG